MLGDQRLRLVPQALEHLLLFLTSIPARAVDEGREPERIAKVQSGVVGLEVVRVQADADLADGVERDIVLGGGDEAGRAQVVALGGLYVIGTNRHESRRIDDQLRGRAGRQGDPGSSRFYISLEDDLIQRYGVMELIPKGQRPERRPDPIEDPVVRREIARAQRIIEGQNFETRRTLWRYSALVDEQRRSVYERRQELLRDEIEPAFCEDETPDHYRELESMVGPLALRHTENLLTMHLLDRHWSDHLALIEDIREGIHLQHYGGRQPLDEFHKQIVEAFAAMMEDVRSEAVAAFRGLSADGGTVNLEQAGFRGPSSTWTYLVNDNPFSSFGVSLLASRNIGFSAAAGLLGVIYFPVTLAISASVLLRRWLRRRRSG